MGRYRVASLIALLFIFALDQEPRGRILCLADGASTFRFSLWGRRGARLCCARQIIPQIGNVQRKCWVDLRGGSETTNEDNSNVNTATMTKDDEAPPPPRPLSLDERVRRAMRKLGIGSASSPRSEPTPPPENEATNTDDSPECQDGVCSIPQSTTPETESSTEIVADEDRDTPDVTVADTDAHAHAEEADLEQGETALDASDSYTHETEEENNTTPEDSADEIDVDELAQSIASDMAVDPSLAMAALGATSTIDPGRPRQYDQAAARNLIQQELDIIQQVSEDSAGVQQLVSEGHDLFLSRRALAFAEMNMDDARAILMADKMDAEEEEEEKLRQQEEAAKSEQSNSGGFQAQQPPFTPQTKEIEVDAGFDPTAFGNPAPQQASPQQNQQPSMPKPAKKSDVVFEATTAQLQELVLESPVPALLDVHAEWCGPCKVLGPVLEEMTVKGGGVFRLVKLNSDNEKSASAALEVTALPTVFGIRDGKIVHMFQGMPRSEEFMKNFMMGLLIPGGTFNPPVTATEKEKYAQLTSKLSKVAGSACFSFSARERLQNRITSQLDKLITEYDGNMADSEDSANVLLSLLSNVIRDPFNLKFRRVNLENKVLSKKVARFSSCLSILRSTGFVSEPDGKSMVLGKGKSVINIAPVIFTRDTIDKWIDQNRYEIAKAARKRQDEMDREKLQLEEEEEDTDEEDDEEEEDPNACKLKLRLEGKKKVHEVVLDGENPLSAIFEPLGISDEEDIQITCVAKRLVVKSSDEGAMQKTLREHGLMPTAALVVALGNRKEATADGSTNKEATISLAERAAASKTRKKGSQTMQSVGIYAKDDNAKAELIDGGGGVWYEHDVSDDEDEPKEGSPAKTDQQEQDTAAENADAATDEGTADGAGTEE